MPTNEFLPFATAGGANVMTQAEYAAEAARLAGVIAGIGKSALANKSWRQSAVMAAMLGQFIADYGNLDALDDGIVANLVRDFARTMQAGTFSVGATSGTNTYTVTLAPAPATLVAGMQFLINFGNANTTTSPTLNPNGLGAKSLLRRGGGAPAAGDFAGWHRVFYDGTAFRLSGLAASEVIAANPAASTTRAPLLARVDATTTTSVALPTSVDTLVNFQTLNGSSLRTSTWNGTRLTIGAGEGGLWDVQAAWAFFTPTTGIFTACRVRKNGTTVLGESGPPYVQAGGGAIIPAAARLPLVVGDYIEILANQQAGSSQFYYADPRARFSATLLSAT